MLYLEPVHWRAADLCEQAAALLKTHATDFSAVSPELRKFIALSSSLYEARAKVSLAKQEQQAENMGLCLSNLKVTPLTTCAHWLLLPA